MELPYSWLELLYSLLELLYGSVLLSRRKML